MSDQSADAELDRRARSFDLGWRAYEAGRPAYPEALFAALMQATGLGPGADVLDVGAGTGNFTVGIAGYGMQITAVEPAANMLRVLTKRLPSGCATIQQRFEDCDLPQHAFDAIFACHSWHWLNKADRVPRCATLLRPGGNLCIVYNVHLLDEDPLFAIRRREIYAKWAPEIEHLDPPPAKLDAARIELAESSVTGPVAEVVVSWQHCFAAVQFVSLLASYSNHIALPPQRLNLLLTEIRELIDSQFGGAVRQDVSIQAMSLS
jgi:ubiquinone/menaquinone biosynthesis C-methylase UbiE